MTGKPIDEVLNWLDSQRDAMTDLLEALVNTESGTGTPSSRTAQLQTAPLPRKAISPTAPALPT